MFVNAYRNQRQIRLQKQQEKTAHELQKLQDQAASDLAQISTITYAAHQGDAEELGSMKHKKRILE